MASRWSMSALLVGILVLGLGGVPSNAHPRGRPFEPSAATLACINAAEGSPSYDQGAGRRYQGAYQMDRAFALAYSGPIAEPHWQLWGSTRHAPTHTWHPMIQDEVARNGIRARGLSPWPPAKRSCAWH